MFVQHRRLPEVRTTMSLSYDMLHDFLLTKRSSPGATLSGLGEFGRWTFLFFGMSWTGFEHYDHLE